MLYLIPFPLDPHGDVAWISQELIDRIISIRIFFCEDEKTTRRILKKHYHYPDVSEITLIPIGKHADSSAAIKALNMHKNEPCMGLVSESGMPAVADPGSVVVAEAHRLGIQVTCLPGPNSIIMTLAASGLNGQSFVFHGYLPIDEGEKKKKIAIMEQSIRSQNQTQLFIEAPHRCNTLLKTLIESLNPSIRLCMGINIGMADERIQTKYIKDWKEKLPEVHKKLVVFAIG